MESNSGTKFTIKFNIDPQSQKKAIILVVEVMMVMALKNNRYLLNI